MSSSQHPEPGLEHFYAAFGLGCSRNLGTSSARAFGIKEDDISEDCSVASAIARRLQPQHGIPCETHVQKKAKTTPPELEVQQVEEQVAASSPNCSDSDASSSSQSSSTAEAGGVESDLEDLEEHYYSNLRRYSAFLDRDRPRHYNTQQLNAQEWTFSGGRDGLQRFLSLPTTWPLARLMFRDLVKQMETRLQTYCFEIAVTCAEAREQSAYVRRMTLHLGQYLAIFLAETITKLGQKFLTPCPRSGG